MATRQTLRLFGVLFLVVAVGGLAWKMGTAEEAKDAAKEGAKDASAATQTLGGDERYLTRVSTDKPIYRPGDKLFVRGVILHQSTNKPLSQPLQNQALVEIKGPKGDTVASGYVVATDSVLGFSWDIPKTQSGGEYTINVSHPFEGHAPGERKFDIRAYRAPRLKSQIKFLRDGYGAGDDVAATLHVERAEGGIPENAKVQVIARVDGEEVFNGSSTVDAKGNCPARFQLPVDIRRGEGTLAMVIEDGGVVETASKTIPILLQTVDLTMYPEGGELVAGLINRIYFEAFTPAKKPADLAGVVLDGEGNKVATFRSEHEGRGRFSLDVKPDGKYVLQITEPAGIKTQYPLPEVKAAGAMLTSETDIFAADEPIMLKVGIMPADQLFSVTLSKREKVIATVRPEFLLTKFDLTANDPAGVLVATVWDKDGKPLAERLIYRQPAKSVSVKIEADAKQYTPGGKARLSIVTTDETGKPISAVVGVTVTDDSVLEMIDKREQAPRLPVMVLLEDDVQELADAHVYLDPQNDKAPLSVDLLLGTQGWRRFAFVDTAKFLEAHGDDARRVVALRMLVQHELDAFRFGGGRGLEGLEKFDGAIPAPAAARLAEAEAKGQGGEVDKPADAAVPAAENANGAALPAQEAAAREAKNAGPDASKKQNALRDEQRGGVEQIGENKEFQDALKAAADGKADRAFAKRRHLEAEVIRNDFVAVRVYAHEVRSNRKPGERTDFTETLYWHAGIKTDEQGKATLEFGLNDSVTSFQVFADAFSDSGALGSGQQQIESVEPFYLEPKLPLEVTAGDHIRLPIGLVNATGATLEQARFTANAHKALNISSPPAPADLAADARLRQLLEIAVGQHNGEAEFTLRAEAGPYRDKVTRKLNIKPQGFPIQFARGGLIAPSDTLSHEITIPDNLVPSSLSGRVIVYPTPLASMTEALEGLIREPYGCFEQTSSTIYPLVMAQQYFMSHQGVDPTLVERSGQILVTGYARLVGFECKSGGFEWFGNDPGHDALTAYGLMEFTDMAKVSHVDPTMLERTRKWLLDQRDGKGGFLRKTHTLHTWLPDPEIANAYNTWALLEAGLKDDLATEAAWVREAAEKTENTYVMALAANVLALAGDKDGENHLLDKLSGKQSDDGSVAGATVSVVGSGGDALTIETTALAVMAWLKNPSYAENVEKSIKYLAESCKAGRFGSTQSTVLALRAIVAYDQSRAKPKAPGSLQLIVNGKPVGEPVAFDEQTQGAIELPKFADALSPGKHQIQVKMNDGSQMPFSLAVEYNSLKPDSSEDCKVHLQVKLSDDKIEEGSVTEANVVAINRTNADVPTPLAIIGIPGGLEVRHDQLKELVKQEKIAAYEVIGREVILYWRVLKAEERVELPISLVAAVPGVYTGPASRAYLYYTDEHKHWEDALKIEITAK